MSLRVMTAMLSGVSPALFSMRPTMIAGCAISNVPTLSVTLIGDNVSGRLKVRRKGAKPSALISSTNGYSSVSGQTKSSSARSHSWADPFGVTIRTPAFCIREPASSLTITLMPRVCANIPSAEKRAAKISKIVRAVTAMATCQCRIRVTSGLTSSE